MANKKLESLRERVRKRKAKRRTKRKSKQLKQERERRDRQERVEKNDPEGAVEKAAATKRQAKLLAAELGVSTNRAESFIENATEKLEAAQEAGNLSEFDLDGDGDTDLLSSVDPVETGDQGVGLDDGSPGSEPVVEYGGGGGSGEPMDASAADVSLDEPTDGEIDF